MAGVWWLGAAFVHPPSFVGFPSSGGFFPAARTDNEMYNQERPEEILYHGSVSRLKEGQPTDSLLTVLLYSCSKIVLWF